MRSLPAIEGQQLLPRLRLPYRSLGDLCRFVDAATLIGASVLAQAAYEGHDANANDAIVVGAIASLVFLLTGRLWGLYKLHALLEPSRIVGRVAGGALTAVLTVVALLFLLRTGAQHSRGQMLAFAFLAPLLVSATRGLFAGVAAHAISADYVGARRVVLIGDLDELSRLTPRENAHFGLEEVARFPLSHGDGREQLTEGDRAKIAAAIEAARKFRAAEFALIVPWRRNQALTELIQNLRASPLPARLYPDQCTRDILLQTRDSGFDPYLSVEVQREPLSQTERACKRALDALAAGFGLIALSPLLVLVAILIKLDSRGPIIFRQTRRGFDNREFKIWKFRTMMVLEDGPQIRQVERHDARITHIGRILRRASLDELPQLVNVLKGEMSIVGPRPHAVAHDLAYRAVIAQYALRHHVKPGITGAAQVLGFRGETATLAQMEARVQRDLWYINHWSLWLDFKIILQTFGALARQEVY